MEQVAHDFVPVLARFFVALWNWLMRLLIRVGLMSAFKARPWLHAVLIFLLMAIAPYVGIFFLVAALVASSHGAKVANNFMGSVSEKKPERFMDAQSDEEEREAYQGEAMLRAYESGSPIEDAMKVHDAIGKVYDMKKSKEGAEGNKPRRRWLSLVGVVILLLISLIPYGKVGFFLMLGAMVDISTIVTVLVARYARKNLHVIIVAVAAAFACEVLTTIISPTHEFGTMLVSRLAGQGILALIVRTWLKKKRPPDRQVDSGG